MTRIATELNKAIDNLEYEARAGMSPTAAASLFALYNLRDLLIEQGLYDEET